MGDLGTCNGQPFFLSDQNVSLGSIEIYGTFIQTVWFFLVNSSEWEMLEPVFPPCRESFHKVPLGGYWGYCGGYWG